MFGQLHNNVLIFVTLCFLIEIPHQVTSLKFNLSNITSNSNHKNLIKLYGNANLTSQGIELTTNTNSTNQNLTYQSGRATYHKALKLYDKSTGKVSAFKTHFTFVINSSGYEGQGDGFAFFLIPNSSVSSNIQSGAAFGLPINPPPYPELSPCVAVEFDTFYNPDWDPQNNPTRTHVGIDINSLKSVASKPWFSDVPRGLENEATISYDPSSNILSVVFTDYYANNNTKVESGFNTTVDLKKYLTDWVSIGFSAATGGLVEKHYVKSWQFNSSLVSVPKSPVTPAPAPSGSTPENPTGSPAPAGSTPENPTGSPAPAGSTPANPTSSGRRTGPNIALVVGLTVGSFFLVRGLNLFAWSSGRKVL